MAECREQYCHEESRCNSCGCCQKHHDMKEDVNYDI